MASSTQETVAKTMTLSELRVFELKQELEKRSLDKSGIKLALVERLETALRGEGHDPKTYVFTVSNYGNTMSSPVKGTVADVSLEIDDSVNQIITENDTEMVDEKNGHQQEGIVGDGAQLSADESKEASGHNEMEGVMESSEIVDDKIECQKNAMDVTATIDEPGARVADVQRLPLVHSAEDEVMKEDAEEVNYEDDDICDTVRQQQDRTDENESKITSGSYHSSNTSEKGIGKELKPNEAIGAQKTTAHSDTYGGSAAETVESMPASARTDGAQQSALMLKKTSNSLWIKGIGPNTKAADLKALFTKYGRVLTAKIFTRRQQPSNSCFGFVTMTDTTAAELCIQKLHKTTVKGHMISVERADRCNMPTVKNVPKKSGAAAVGDAKSGKSVASTEDDAKRNGKRIALKAANEKLQEHVEQQKVADEKVGSTGGDSLADELDLPKVTPSKRSPVKAPSVSSTHSKFSTHSTFSSRKQRHHTSVSSRPSMYRGVRRGERGGYMPAHLRRTIVTHRPSFSASAAAAAAAAVARRSYIVSSRARFGRGPISSSRIMMRREVSSRRVDSSTSSAVGVGSWDKREMLEILRKKDEEHRLKEQELRLQRERERLKFERERFERERLELQQLRQIAALAAPNMQPLMVAAAAASAVPTPPTASARRTHDDYANLESDSRRMDYTRPTSNRPSHRTVTSSSSHGVTSDRHESRSSSRHISTIAQPPAHSVSERSRERDHDRVRERERERERDRSRRASVRDMRDYSSTTREPAVNYSRDSYGRTADSATLQGNYGRDSYRSDSGYSHQTAPTNRTNISNYCNRDVGYSSNTYQRDMVPSSYSKDAVYGNSSRSLSSGVPPWHTNSGSSMSASYMGSTRDYDASNAGWMSMASAHGHSATGNGNSGGWSSRADDNWPSGNSGLQQDQHNSVYDKFEKPSYDRYNSYEKYSRRY